MPETLSRQDVLDRFADEQLSAAAIAAEVEKDRARQLDAYRAQQLEALDRAKDLNAARIEACKRIEAGAREMAEGVKAALSANAEMMTILGGGATSPLARQSFLKRLSFWLSAVFESVAGSPTHFGYLKIVGGRRAKAHHSFAEAEQGWAKAAISAFNSQLNRSAENGHED